MASPRFITTALPYANGPLHFGHLAGVYIPADIYTRHCQLSGIDCVHISGSDEHGVAITLSAEKNKVPYQDWVDRWNQDHQDLFAKYQIDFTHFGRTTSDIHKKYAQEFFKLAHKGGYLKENSENQAYDIDEKKFLPDRYLMGICPKCDYEEARGDECPNCGSWLKANELKNPRSATSGSTNIEWKEVKQWYFDLPKLKPDIKKWLDSKTNWKPRIKNYALSLLEDIPERAITRNVEWGIDLPDEFYEEGKKIYVWFEAPVGYYSNLVEYFEKRDEPEGWKKFWNKDSEMIHFIGKDNIIFHTIIWPGLLMAVNKGNDGEPFSLPTNVPANMFVQLMKKQFSKSSGWYVDAKEALDTYGADRMRYYLTSIIPETEDTSFDWNLFREKVNADLVNKIANLFNRVGKQILKHYDGKLNPIDIPKDWHASVYQDVHQALETFEINKALSRIIEFTEEANKFLDQQKPWNVVKDDKERAIPIFQEVYARYLLPIAGMLQPFLPAYSNRLLQNFSVNENSDRTLLYQGHVHEVLKNKGIYIQADSDFVISRIEPDQIDAEIQKLAFRLKSS